MPPSIPSHPVASCRDGGNWGAGVPPRRNWMSGGANLARGNTSPSNTDRQWYYTSYRLLIGVGRGYASPHSQLRESEQVRVSRRARERERSKQTRRAVIIGEEKLITSARNYPTGGDGLEG